MEAKHTKGPWSYERDLPHGYHHVVRAVFANGHVIGQIYGGEGGEVDNSDANARLIAAAPELLEALIAAEAALNHIRCTSRSVPWDETGPAVEQARAAIAKANA